MTNMLARIQIPLYTKFGVYLGRRTLNISNALLQNLLQSLRVLKLFADLGNE
jgi:hypothetical protein